jgi:hypothetical protein
MKIKDLSLRLTSRNTSSTFRKPNSYLASPNKYFYPMNVFDSQKTFLTFTKKRSEEKIPDFLREILMRPASKPRSDSKGRVTILKDSEKAFNKRKSCFVSRPNSGKVVTKKETGSQERVLYKPTVFSINSRSKVTLYTLSNFRSGSEARFTSAKDCSGANEVFKAKLRNRKVKFLVPEFRKDRVNGPKRAE